MARGSNLGRTPDKMLSLRSTIFARKKGLKTNAALHRPPWDRDRPR
jgi:hypothetical protein